MVAALTRIFGVHNVGLAEDVAQDALCRALTVWKFSGPPENPSAWLMATAKNRALDVLRRERTARRFAPELGRWLESEWTLGTTVDELFEPRAVKDDQLRMMFSCCPPRLPEPAQVALVLNVLCGFSASEVASALLTSEAATEKRISRAKKVLASSSSLFELQHDRNLEGRLASVQRTLYLLFNEGYHGASPERAVRATLCHEAMHLARSLLDHDVCRTPASLALVALMSFHAARLPARLDANGNLTSLLDQDRTLWDPALTAEGERLLDLSAAGTELSEYHVEAAIAATHASAPRADETRWGDIVGLYDKLMIIRPSPVVAMSRAIALGEDEGPEAGLRALRAISNAERLDTSPFYAAAIAELELRSGRPRDAERYFHSALARARSPMETNFLEARLRRCSAELDATGTQLDAPG